MCSQRSNGCFIQIYYIVKYYFLKNEIFLFFLWVLLEGKAVVSPVISYS